MSTSNRRQPTRSVRSSATRPPNYYARPFSFRSSTGGIPTESAPVQKTGPGFFPGIQHFTDGVAALPKEVMRHFTLLKETEGKAYQPDLAIGELLNTIAKLPSPARKPADHHDPAYFGFSLTNSASGSANGSVVDGNLPSSQRLPTEQLDQSQELEGHNEARRMAFVELQSRLREMTMVLDEKNMVLSSANDTLARQLARLDSAMPGVESEISEEARLGSNTHWALPHMKELRRSNIGGTNERSRRDVMNANSLAAAAAAVHEGDIAATRSEARREALAAKQRRNHAVDSDFEERPPAKRPQPSKARRGQDTQGTVDGKSATGANQPNKRRRVDKGNATTVDRATATVVNGRGGAKTSGREGRADGGRKRAKAVPAQAVARKKNAANSPATASPTRGTFATTANKEFSPAPSMQRGPSRARQGSTQSITNPDNARARPAPTTSQPKGQNGVSPSMGSFNTVVGGPPRTAAEFDVTREIIQPTASKPHTPMDQSGEIPAAIEAPEVSTANTLKREETEPAVEEEDYTDQQKQIINNSSSRGDSRSNKIGSEAAATGMSRSRSTRGVNAPAGSASSPQLGPTSSPRRSHKKGASYSNSAAHPDVSPERSSTSTADDHDKIPSIMASTTNATTSKSRRAAAAAAATTTAAVAPNGEEEELNIEDPDPDAEARSDEPRYCICRDFSYGDMIACDNRNCPTEWFHLQCVGLTKPPGSKTKWYCEDCRKDMKRGGARNNGSAAVASAA